MSVKPKITVRTQRRGGVNSFTITGIPPIIELKRGGAFGGSRWVLNKKKVRAYYTHYFRQFKKILARQMSQNRSTGNYSYQFESTGDVMVYNGPGIGDSKYGEFLRNINHRVDFVEDGLKRGFASRATLVIDLSSSLFYSPYIDEASGKTKTIRLKKGVYPIFSRRRRKVVWYTVSSSKIIVLRNKPINSYEAFKQAQDLVNLNQMIS